MYEFVLKAGKQTRLCVELGDEDSNDDGSFKRKRKYRLRDASAQERSKNKVRRASRTKGLNVDHESDAGSTSSGTCLCCFSLI